MAVVLCTGVDKVLLRTRALILESAGHHVIGAVSEAEVIAACKQHHFDVVVVGQAMHPAQKKRVFDLARQTCPTAKVLELFHAAKGKTLPAADGWLEVPTDVPADLAEKVTELAGK